MSEPKQFVCHGCKRRVMSRLPQPDGWEGDLCRRCAIVAHLLLGALRLLGRLTA